MEDWERKKIVLDAKKWLNNHDKDSRTIDDFLAWQFDDNYYAEGCGIVLGNHYYIPIESIWTNNDGHTFVHCSGNDLEADFEVRLLDVANVKRVIDMLIAKYALVL